MQKQKNLKKKRTKKVQKKKRKEKRKKKRNFVARIKVILIALLSGSVITHGNSVRYHRNGISNLQIV